MVVFAVVHGTNLAVASTVGSPAFPQAVPERTRITILRRVKSMW